MTTHVCLINSSFTAALTPVIDLTISSDNLVIVTESAYQKEAALLLSIARIRGYKGEIVLLPDTHSTLDIKLFMVDLFNRLTNSDNDIWLNATGGNRYHALAAFEVAREFELPVYVVEPNHDSLFWLYPEDKPAIPIEDKLKLHEYFTLFGISLENCQPNQGIPQAVRKLTAKWCSDIEYYRKGISALNYYASVAQDTDQATLDETYNNNQALLDILEDLEQLGYLSISRDTITFSNQKNRFFCNGGWLEEWCFATIKKLSSRLPSIQDLSYAVEVTRQYNRREVKNELDLVALVNNKLHIIECKTGKLNNESSNQILYRLNSLTELIGDTAGRAALVTYNKVPASVAARAVELDINILGPDQLPNLSSHLERWLANA